MAGSSPRAPWADGALQAVTVVHRLHRWLRRVGAAGAAVPLGRAHLAGPAGPAGVVGPAGPSGPAGPPDPVLGRVLDRAQAAGAPAAVLGALADVWRELTVAQRRAVDRPLGDGRPGPLRIGGAPVRQVDGTTCGSTALAMLAAAGDPVLALWLVTGRHLPGPLPRELRRLPAATLASPDAAARLAALQRAVQRASTRRALGPLPWPVALGTPPWGAARTARFPATTWTHVLVDDTDDALVDAVLDHADAALAAGVPVPLFTGGDLRGGPAAAVPRHVVLLVPADADAGTPAAGGPDDGSAAYAVLEPGRGLVHRVTRRVLARPGGPHPALGGWSHVCWAVLPLPAAPRSGSAWHAATGGTTMGVRARPPSTQEER